MDNKQLAMQELARRELARRDVANKRDILSPPRVEVPGETKLDVLGGLKAFGLNAKDSIKTAGINAGVAMRSPTRNSFLPGGMPGQQEQVAQQDQFHTERLKNEYNKNQEALAPTREEFPGSSFFGSIAPAAMTFPLGTSLPGGIAAGAGIGLMQGNPESQGANALLGAGLGGTGNMLGRAVPFVKTKSKNYLQKTADRIKKADETYKFLPSQRKGMSEPTDLQKIIESQPLAGNSIDKIHDVQSRALNKEAARLIDMPGKDKLTDDVLGAASDKITQRYSNLTNSIPDNVKINDKFLDDLVDIETNFVRIPGGTDKSLGKLVEDLTDLAEKGKISRADYQRFQSAFRTKAAAQFTTKSGDPIVGKAFFKAADMLDDQVENSLGKEALKEFKEAGRLYKNFQLITRNKNTIDKTGAGDINAKTLVSELIGQGSRKNTLPKDYSYLNDLAIMKAASGSANSQTTNRSLANAAAPLGFGAAMEPVLAPMGLPGVGTATGLLGPSLGSKAYLGSSGRQLLPSGTDDFIGGLLRSTSAADK